MDAKLFVWFFFSLAGATVIGAYGSAYLAKAHAERYRFFLIFALLLWLTLTTTLFAAAAGA